MTGPPEDELSELATRPFAMARTGDAATLDADTAAMCGRTLPRA